MKEDQISLKNELLRKSIHLSVILIPFFYLIFGREIALNAIFLVMVFVIFIDIFSKENMPLNKFIFTTLGSLIREHEKDKRFWKLNGASWVMISAFLTFLLFPEVLAITSFVILVISDLVAAIVGKKYGVHKFLGKSLEGSFSFLVSGLIVILLIYQALDLDIEFLYFGIPALVIAGAAEAFSNKLGIDDNLSVPFSFCIFYILLENIFK